MLDPRAHAEKLERMMAMYERLKAKEAELAYNAAKGGVAAVDRIDRCQGRERTVFRARQQIDLAKAFG